MSRLLALLCLIGPLGAHAAQGSGALGQAEELVRRANQQRDAEARFRLADEALALAERAAKEAPDDPEPLLTAASALMVNDLRRPEECRPNACERAVELLRRARAIDKAGLYAHRVASELGLFFSRLRRFEEALAEYDRALRTVAGERIIFNWDEADGRAVLLGNSAETLMAMGRLDEAIARYRLAEAAAQSGGTEWELALWGLGVALDRDEKVDAARAAIARALSVDPTMGRLGASGVFFEPPGDKFYYLALGHEVAGDLAQAQQAWRDYLATPSPRWAARARAHLAALKGRPATPDTARLRVTFREAAALGGTRSALQVFETLRRQEEDIKLCYARARRLQREAAGELHLVLEVRRTGFVAQASVFGATGGVTAALGRCVELSAQSWRFDPAEGDRDDTVSIRLRLDPK